MILIDDKRTVIAGEALAILAEVAVLADRLIEELSANQALNINYEELQGRLFETITKVRKYRGPKKEISPNEILVELDLKDIFTEEVFHNFSRAAKSRRTDTSSSKSAEDMLKEAMKKLQKSKKKSKDKGDKKNKKDKGDKGNKGNKGGSK
jgi:hypothetical protein